MFIKLTRFSEGRPSGDVWLNTEHIVCLADTTGCTDVTLTTGGMLRVVETAQTILHQFAADSLERAGVINMHI